MGEIPGASGLNEGEIRREQMRLQNEMGAMMHRLTPQYEKEQNLLLHLKQKSG